MQSRLRCVYVSDTLMATADVVLERGLPASADAERSPPGAILLKTAFPPQPAESLRAKVFSLNSPRRIYGRMVDLNETGRAIDIIPLAEELSRHKEVEAVGGVAY